jgi:endoglucanase
LVIVAIYYLSIFLTTKRIATMKPQNQRQMHRPTSFSKKILLGWILFISVSLQAQHQTTDIRLNQIGFYPAEEKIAVLVKNIDGKFFITTPDLSETVFTGELSGPHKSTYSPVITRIADFSSFRKVGTFVLYIPEVGFSYQFSIKPNVHGELANAALKSFYFQRMSIPLAYSFAGKWSRPAGHPDNKVLVHGSAATKLRPEGTVLSSPGGWYDAGDYNKYAVNSGITLGTLLSLYEDFPADCDPISVNIPESNNRISDLLDEALWNLRWMLTMQDPNDGGVYHKLTNAGFDAFIAPADAKAPRYVVQKSTAAALDFAAVTAQAARIFRKFSKELPGLADSCLVASEKAWNWAQKNPFLLYSQKSINAAFDPDITTGEYGDSDVTDEFIWAASELYVTTKESYYTSVNLFPDKKMPVPNWGNVRLLGYYTLLRFEKALTSVASRDLPSLKKNMISLSDSLLKGYEENAYMTPLCKTEKNFMWGSNSEAANQAIALVQTYKLSNRKEYLTGAIHVLDYLLGRNATGYSYVTGCGSKSPMHPHHRPSASDEIIDPVPGLLVGGPNPGRQDNCKYPSVLPDEAYVDVTESYASNEVAINWNAPLVYLVFAVEFLTK